MSSKLRKFLSCWFDRFAVIFLLINVVQNVVDCSDSASDSNKLQPFDIISKQSQDCGQLDITPDDIRTFAPWSAAIYRTGSKNKWEFHTSGAIIGPGLIISVQAGQPGRFPSDKNPHKFFIAAGIKSTDFDSHDQFAQYSRVSLIQPFVSKLNSYSHIVVYHLETPLDVKNTSFVRHICYPFFASNRRFKNNLADAVHQSLRFEYIQFGFTLSANHSDINMDHKLKTWKGITLPREQCEAILRFYYSHSSNPVVPLCKMRNLENIRGFLPLAKILDKLKASDSGDEEEENDYLCHGPGSGTMITFGNNWFLGTTIWFVPSRKKSRCNSKTVYFGAVSEEVEMAARWIYNVFKCPLGKFSCGNSQKCVDIEQTCDEKQDCDDSSDEDPILCEWKKRENSNSNSNSNSLSFKFKNKRFQVPMNFNVTLYARDLTKKCPILQFSTEGVRCRDAETLELLDCQRPFFSGRQILVDCDDYHTAPKFTTKSMNILCNAEGNWSKLESIVCQKKCGIYELTSTTVTRKNQGYKRFPWHAAIFKKDVHLCAGSLIQDNFILSHAQCVKEWIQFPGERSVFNVFVRPVSSNYQENRSSKLTLKTAIKDVWISVNDKELESGIALIKLETPVLTNREDAPMAVCSLVPPLSKISLGKIGKVFTSDQQETAQNFNVIPGKECDEILSGRSIVDKNEFCAASNPAQETKDENENEILRGSGFIYEREATAEKNSSNVLLGVASESKDGQAVFLELNSFSDWIIDILETNS